MGLTIEDLAVLINTSITQLSTEISTVKNDLLQRMDSITTGLSEIHTKCDRLEEENSKLSRENLLLADAVMRGERKCQVTIGGVPVLLDEQPLAVFERIALAINFNVGDASAVKVYRMKRSPKDSSSVGITTRLRSKNTAPTVTAYPMLLVNFSNTWDKADFWFKFLSHGKLSLKDIGIATIGGIFISENLTKHNYTILQACRDLKKKGSILNYHTKNGICCIVRKAGDNPIQIFLLDQLKLN